jgi:hypothetical protein
MFDLIDGLTRRYNYRTLSRESRSSGRKRSKRRGVPPRSASGYCGLRVLEEELSRLRKAAVPQG